MNEKIKALLAQRVALLAEAETLLNNVDVDGFNAKEKEIQALDTSIEALKLANANLQALQDNPVGKDIADQTVEPPTATTTVTQTAPAAPHNVLADEQTYENAFAKFLMGQQMSNSEETVFDNTNTKFQNTLQTAEKHAVLIPETVARGIWKEAEGLYPILADVGLTYVPGSLTLYKENESGNDAEWYDEDTEVVDDELAIGTLNLTGCELAKSIPVSWKLRRMAVKDFIDYVKTKLAEKMGAALAKGIVIGKGKPGNGDVFKPQARGIVTALNAEVNTPQVKTYVLASGISYSDLTAAMAVVKSSYKKGAKIYADSMTIWNQLAKILDENGRPIFIPDATANGIGRIFGLVVEEDDSVPTNSVLIANASKGYAGNVNQDMAIYTEDHVKARKTDYMGYAIVDGDVVTTKAFAYVTPAA